MATTLGFPVRRDRLFYATSSVVIGLIVLIGFSKTFYLNQFFADRHLPIILIIHDVVFVIWLLFLIVQALLVVYGKMQLHRILGWVGLGWAVLMNVAGLFAAIYSARNLVPQPDDPPVEMLLAIPIFDLIVFSSLVVAGIACREWPEAHKRLMLLSAISILAPGIARLPLAFAHSHGVLSAFIIADLLMIAFILCDTILHRRLHPAFLWGGLWVVFSIPLRMLVSATPWWHWFAHWLITL